MGTTFRIVLYSADQKSAQAAADSAFARVKELDLCMSDYLEESELMRLCMEAKPGTPSAISNDLATVLRRGAEISRLSDGAFDVTVGPVVRLWREARSRKRLPSPAQLQSALTQVGYQHLRIGQAASESSTAILMKPKMRLDLGGIAKGFAADQAILKLRKRGFPKALVDAGGDIVVGSPPPGQVSWAIKVARHRPESPATPHPRAHQPPPLSLAHRAVASSGDLYQGVEIGGRRWSHIVDPRTGLGLTHRTQVTVVARDGATADALASALSVMGRKQGLKLVESLKQVEACWITGPSEAQGGIREFRSSGFSALAESKKTMKVHR